MMLYIFHQDPKHTMILYRRSVRTDNPELEGQKKPKMVWMDVGNGVVTCQ